MKNVEDIYPLSPMQEMMLLRTLSHGDTDVLFNQVSFTAEGPVDVDAFRVAWQTLSDRHPVLRTAFMWDKLKRPMQIVRDELEVEFEYLDWSAKSAADQEADLESFRADDRRRGFDPTKAPLHRLALIRTGDASSQLVWSTHHLIFDRWCLSTFFEEFAVCYESGSAAALGPAYPYRDYIAWVERQDANATRAFWSVTLSGFDTPTPLSVEAVSKVCGDVHTDRNTRKGVTYDAFR